MEEEETVDVPRAVSFVQQLDSVARAAQQRLVFRKRFLLRIAEIRQQAEMQVLVPICQKSHFERFKELINLFNAAQERRNHDEGAQVRRQSVREVHFGQAASESEAATPASS